MSSFNFMNKTTYFQLAVFIVLIITSLVYSACRHKPDIFIEDKPIISTNCSSDTVYFQNEVLPLLLSTCATSGCHNAIDAKEGIVLVDYPSVIKFGGINFEHPEESEIYEVLSSDDDRMPPPPAPEWSAEQKDILLNWIKQGAINNECQQLECDTINITYPETIIPILQNNCYSCHNELIQEGGVNLKDYETVSEISQNGKLLGMIKRLNGYSPMPPNQELDLCSVQQIESWINDTTFIPPGGGNDHPCDPDTVYFQNEILPLLLSSCATTGCHDEQTSEDGVVLVDYASIIETGKIKPGDPGDSELYEVLFKDDPEERMPPSPKDPLTPEQKSLIEKWILQGAKNNYCDADCDTTNVTFSGSVWPVMQTNCVGCHSGGNPSGDILITNYEEVALLVDNGYLMGVIKQEGEYKPMPPNGAKLSDCDIATIEIWIKNGKPND